MEIVRPVAHSVKSTVSANVKDCTYLADMDDRLLYISFPALPSHSPPPSGIMQILLVPLLERRRRPQRTVSLRRGRECVRAIIGSIPTVSANHGECNSRIILILG